MVMSMGVSPVVVGRKRQHTQNTADPVVDSTLGEERAMTAIMLDHEEPDEKARRRQRHDQRKPIAVESDQPHRRPQCREASRRDRDLAQSPQIILATIFGKAKG